MDYKRLSKMKPLKLREDSGIDISLKNLIAIVIGVSMGIFAYHKTNKSRRRTNFKIYNI